MNLLGFGKAAEAQLELQLDATGRRALQVRDRFQRDAEPTRIAVFAGEDKLSGRVEVRPDRRRKLEHAGIRVELLGLIETTAERVPNSTFMSSAVDLEPPGTLAEDRVFDFSFPAFQKPFESYYGVSVRLRYVVRASVGKNRSAALLTREQEVAVLLAGEPGCEPAPISMEVGIEDCLNIAIDIPRNVFSLRDAIEGRITFAQVRVQIERMELNLVRKETVGAGEAATTHTDEFYAFEIMDGCPARAEEIPIRMFLAGVPDLSATVLGANNKFSVRYFLNLVIIDDLKRRYFKQSEIHLHRASL